MKYPGAGPPALLLSRITVLPLPAMIGFPLPEVVSMIKPPSGAVSQDTLSTEDHCRLYSKACSTPFCTIGWYWMITPESIGNALGLGPVLSVPATVGSRIVRPALVILPVARDTVTGDAAIPSGSNAFCMP